MIIEKAVQKHPELNKWVFFDADGKFKGRFAITENKEIWDVLIFRRYRGNNLAEVMLKEFLDENPGNWTLFVAKNNIPAKLTYEKLGFKYISNPEIDFLGILEMRI